MRTSKKRVLRGAAVVGVLALVALNGPSVQASSHREAPLISQDPVADNTDLYMFRDPANPTMVNIVANFIGLEQPASGPNFVRFGDDVLYEIHIDNNGDVADDITYQFRFRTTIANPNTFLYNTGPIAAPNAGAQNVRQTYSIRRIDRTGSTLVAKNIDTPPVNVGPRSTRTTSAAYEAELAQPTVTTLPGGGKVFAGQRSEPFYADLGSLFDLLGLREAPFATGHDIDQPAEPGRDGLADKNVHTIALQLPIASVLAPGASGVDAANGSIVGSYASSSRRQTRVLSTSFAGVKDFGRWVQISRLGLPLVNEILIPLGQKDRWNFSDPEDDVAQFGNFILDPEPAKLVGDLYSDTGIKTPPGGAANRPDLLKLLTAQLIGAPAAGPGSQAPADLLRVNLATPVTGGTGQNQNTVNRLGAIGGDNQGFPNGRRLADDVVDIQLRVFAGGVLLPPYNVFPNNALTDGVGTSGSGPLLNTFPYAGTPISGFDQNDSFG